MAFARSGATGQVRAAPIFLTVADLDRPVACHEAVRPRLGTPAPGAVHVGVVAGAQAQVRAAPAAALAAGAEEIHPPGPQLHYDPRYYAAQVRHPGGHSLALVFKSWQHPEQAAGPCPPGRGRGQSRWAFGW